MNWDLIARIGFCVVFAGGMVLIAVLNGTGACS